ncbi:metalloregulator ArsR/SmtB family transcription factor [Spirosoma sp. HMF4905]|uniref:Metalloregulator ArsR/SmtB family transcription factor n=1 Tax=Spirosoma arboris TaxID=2682092 RepID=A0A7K1SJE7_9BACT|nr:metalloregulator ArsR/SmtB family transcription factor [Spirosoma arboris]MVM33864.1 metalloregulator ArsR/SmtB family transcription factor [Spirosoma arboris]
MDSPLHRYKAEFFKTLGHPLRLAILDALRSGPLSVTELQAVTKADQSMLSQHLSRLRNMNFVTARREATTIFYQVHDQEIYQFLDLARQIYGRQLKRSEDILTELNQA